MSDIDERWQQIVNDNEYLIYEVKHLKECLDQQKRESVRYLWATSSVCAMVGFGLAMVVTPMPKGKGDCGVFKVNEKPVTAFVLKPPPAPPPEKVIVKEACPAPKVEEASPAQEKAEEKPRRKRHYRVRRYWR